MLICTYKCAKRLLQQMENCVFYRYLIEQGCNLAAVNNDGELALDIAESDEMEDMLQQHINKAGLYLYVYLQDV